MNEQLQAQLSTILEMLEKSSTTAMQFGAEQIPLILQELLLWKFAVSLLAFIACLSAILIPLLLLFSKRYRSLFWDNDLGVTEPWIAFYMFIILPFIGILDNLDWLQIWLAPRVYLLEYVTNLLS